MRLGEYFIQKGIITKPQLEQALRAQLIFGGHLGTCLMEMGLVDEQLLGESLASIFGVRYAPPGLFADIPRSVIESMTQRLVEKYHAVPFERTNRMLHLAMIDPKNLPALDEISFATACKIEPWVAPEARIYQVMERYYDIPRRQRYIAVCQDMDGAASGQRRTATQDVAPPAPGNAYAPPPYLEALGKMEAAPPQAPAPATAARTAAPRAAEHWEGGPPPALPMQPGSRAQAMPQPQVAPQTSPAPQTPPAQQIPAAPQAHGSWPASPTFRPATAPQPGRPVVPPAPPEPPAPPAPQDRGARSPSPFEEAQPPDELSSPSALAAAFENDQDLSPLTQETLSNRLCQAESAEDLSRCALEYAARGLRRCALFLIRSTNATLWCSRGLESGRDRGRILNLSVTSDPLFELLLERDHYRGPVPEDVGIHASFKSMRIEIPQDLILIPGYVEDRMVILLYGDGGVDGSIQGDTADLCTLVKKLSFALHVVMLKRKLRSLDLRAPSSNRPQAA